LDNLWLLELEMSTSPAETASKFLLDLAHGRYDQEVIAARNALLSIEPVLPWVAIVSEVGEALLTINKATAPKDVIPDGHGGYVSASNSRIGLNGNFL
jgi:hypothetical protein